MKDNRQRLFEVMGKVDPTFKPNAQLLKEWNFDKKKGEDKEEDKETKEHEESETPAEEKAEHEPEKKGDKDSKEHEKGETPAEEKKELKETDAPAAKKIPVNMIAKVGGK